MSGRKQTFEEGDWLFSFNHGKILNTRGPGGLHLASFFQWFFFFFLTFENDGGGGGGGGGLRSYVVSSRERPDVHPSI